MRMFSLLATSVCLGASIVAQNPIVGETPASTASAGGPIAAMSVSGGNQSGPSAAAVVLPKSHAAKFGNSNNNIPLSWTPSRYQQVFLGTEFPSATQLIQSIAFRQDNFFANFKGACLDMEIKMGYTTMNSSSLGTAFDKNWAATPITVLKRQFITMPNMPATKPTNPALFFFKVFLDTPFVFLQSKKQNFLVEIKVFGNSKGNAIFTFPLDAASLTTSSRLYGLSGPTATTGTLGTGFGLIMQFDSVKGKNKNCGGYGTYGSGCPGTGGFAGHVAPLVAKSRWGNTANAWTFGTTNQRWQQQIDASEMPKIPTRFISFAERDDEASRSAAKSTLNLVIKFGMTTKSSSTMTSTFATNADKTQTTVFSGSVSLPAVSGGNKNLGNFNYVVPLKTPYIYIPTKGQHFLIEIVNNTATTSLVRRYPDAFSGTSVPGSRVYANSCPTCASGTLGKNHMMAIGFGVKGGKGSAPPVLSNTGAPTIGKSFSVDLSSAKPKTAALLTTGGSDKTWGAIPLPFDLRVLGAPGCNVLASLDFVIPVPTDAAGSAKVTFPLPNATSLLGAKFFNQYLVVDPTANAFGIVTSNGGRGVIGQ